MCTVAACSSDGGSAPPDAGPLPPVEEPLPYVNPFMGTGGFGFAHGSAFVGACAPNGLAKVGPDTTGPFASINFLHYSGYWFGDDTIQGFSQVHLHGTGATDYGLVSLMPVASFDPAKLTAEANESRFLKANEIATPGYYAVTLDAAGVRAELTATTHAAHHRYTYDTAATSGAILFDLAKHLDGGEISVAEVTLDAATQTLRGRVHQAGGMSGGFGGYDLFFEGRTRQPWTAAQVWSDGTPPATGTTAVGTGVGFALTFATTGTPGTPAAPIEVQLGLSFVSAAGAAANLAAELPAFDFDGTRAATSAEWNARLKTFRVEGGTAAERTIFYTSLYHAFLMPTVTSDVDGQYRYGDAVHQTDGFRFLSDMSLWDTYRTLHPLYTLIAPDLARDSVRSLHAMAMYGGGFPRWPIATGEAGTMIGASADVVIADAYVKGVTDFDVADVWARLRAAALDPVEPPGGRGARADMSDYRTLGYVPGTESRATSKTSEYAANDFALAQLAAALGEDADATTLATRALGYRQLYDPAVGFLHDRFADGTFADTSDFDPLDFADDYAEANAWQSVWMALHDVDGLAESMGGRAAFVTKLEEFFTEARADLEARPFGDITASASPRPYYWHGNEPDIQAAYLFAQAGRVDLTSDWVRWIRANLYNAVDNGVPGNDDGGTMGAWYVWSALGLYPLAGSDRYFLGVPQFPRVDVRVGGATRFTVVAPELAAGNVYVQGVTLGGAAVAGVEVRHADLQGGVILGFAMAANPVMAW